MQAHTIGNDHAEPRQSYASGAGPERSPQVVVCVDTAGEARTTIPPAKAVARALGAKLAFLHVIETHGAADKSPFDPVEWNLRRREAEAHVSRLADEHANSGAAISTHVLEGRCAERICGILSGRPQDVAVLCRGQDETGPHIGETARAILENGTSSLLMVPATGAGTPKRHFARIIIPLDGSAQSECALPFAQKIAASESAELVLVHATPEPVFTQAGPAEPGDDELKDQVRRRNERVAQKYLDRLCARIRQSGLQAKAVVLRGGDVRRQLTGSVSGQSADLVVIASQGHGGFTDVRVGDVASFVVSRSSVPVLMVRCMANKAAGHVFSAERLKGVRGPSAYSQ